MVGLETETVADGMSVAVDRSVSEDEAEVVTETEAENVTVLEAD